MSGFLPPLLTFAVVLALVLGLAVLLIVGALAAAAVLPRGNSHADRLRRFAREVPRWVWRAVVFLDGFVFAAAVAGGIAVTFALS
ncbi:hypothetical protein [Variovorax arabinosiphilus]|uniref:hypothetical protein n=1 Tax=Variovorax arabinosiphilus TaxID=3053498 RepID=UPI0025751366|nr:MULTISPECIES: hypothetical protein [unclassified Variovorax]MDM0122831.1 hypothetical protein [Variovorax sp. J2L1-78]MDM0132173.1 hypothetical protein [Variovorax sp. J2L1-63]MDM0235594.1 hypothetical protein [Variovorax sp. J2R1-6]